MNDQSVIKNAQLFDDTINKKEQVLFTTVFFVLKSSLFAVMMM